MSLKLDTIHDLEAQNPMAVRKLVEELKAQTQAALAEIRQIAYDLRPPALDELGLIGALQEQIAQNDRTCGVNIVLEAPESLPALSAAVEVAVYRITLAVMTTITNQEGATHCRICLSAAGDLCLEITCDGLASRNDFRSWAELTSISETAEELGGNCLAEVLPGGSAHVVVRLPMSVEYTIANEGSGWTQSEF